ncbi:MAG: ABC transporter permease [Roseococcus sp.]|nr:ABC transporter permease [Roseococcus sp.]
MVDRVIPVSAYDAAAPNRRGRAHADLREGFSRWRLAWVLARSDITHRYRGSVLGPLWMTLSTAIMLLCLGLLYSKLFQLELAVYLPWLGVSLIIWTVISQVFADAGSTLTSAEGIIRQMPVPYTVQALRTVFRNILVAAHNLPLIAIVFYFFDYQVSWSALGAVAGLLLLCVNAFWLSLLLGILCARFRDIPPIIGSLVQVAFFATPVIWKPELILEWEPYLPLNPFFAIMEVVRGPILGTPVSAFVWVMALFYTAIIWTVAQAFFVRFRGRVAFWV